MMDWQEVAIDCETHIKRVVDMYEELGFEVRMVEVDPKELQRCIRCLKERGEKMYRVYTKRNNEVRE